MPNLANEKESQLYGGLGNAFDCEDMVAQCKVMYDNIDPMKQGINDKDVIRLYQIKEKLINILIELEQIIILNEN